MAVPTRPRRRYKPRRVTLSLEVSGQKTVYDHWHDSETRSLTLQAAVPHRSALALPVPVADVACASANEALSLRRQQRAQQSTYAPLGMLPAAGSPTEHTAEKMLEACDASFAMRSGTGIMFQVSVTLTLRK